MGVIGFPFRTAILLFSRPKWFKRFWSLIFREEKRTCLVVKKILAAINQILVRIFSLSRYPGSYDPSLG
jgi:hypothetical protein